VFSFALLASPASATQPGSNGPLLYPNGLVTESGAVVWDSAAFNPTNGAFSADGSKIAYTASDVDVATIRVRTASGDDSVIARFPDQPYVDKITWSGDGLRLAVLARDLDYRSTLWLVRTDGTAPRALVAGSGSWDPEGADWRPGSSDDVAYSRGEDIFTVNAATGVQTQRTFECSYDFSPGGAADCGSDADVTTLSAPSWSPDGTRLLVDTNVTHSPSDGSPDTYDSYLGVLTLGAAAPVRVIDRPSDPAYGPSSYGPSSPIFSPDGTKVAFKYKGSYNTSEGNVWYVMGLAGGTPHPLPASIYWVTDWQPCPGGVCASFGKQTPLITLTVLRDSYGINAISSLKPAHPGMSIRFVLARKTATGSWSNLSNAQVPQTAKGIAVHAFSRPRSGTCRIVASFAGDIDHTSTSIRKVFSC
jgi:WD40 repeat protein